MEIGDYSSHQIGKKWERVGKQQVLLRIRGNKKSMAGGCRLATSRGARWRGNKGTFPTHECLLVIYPRETQGNFLLIC